MGGGAFAIMSLFKWIFPKNDIFKGQLMKRLFFALLLGFMSANADRLSDTEWDDLYMKCAKDKVESACKTLISNGLPNVKACDKDSCLQVGVIYWQIGATQKGLSFYTKSCELGSADGCASTANVFEYGWGNVPKNLTTAIKYSAKACKLDSYYACMKLSTIASNYYNGTNGYARNYAKAKEYYELACNNYGYVFMGSCFTLGTMYHKGQGTQKDFFKAFELFKKVCETENFNKGKACERLGSLYKNGEGIKQNLPLAKKYFGVACDLKVQAGCASYKKLNEQGVADIKEETNFWDRLLK